MIDLSTLTGLALAPGKALQLKLFAAAAVLLIAATLYAVHYFTAKGYDQAAAECAARARDADVHRLELEKQAEEDRRDIAIWNALGRQRIKAAAATQRDEVKRDYEAKPALPVCDLGPDRLRRWNAPIGPDTGLQVRPGRADADRSGARDAATLAVGEPARSGAEPDQQQGGIRGIADGRAGLGFRVPRVPQVAGQDSRTQQAGPTSPTD